MPSPPTASSPGISPTRWSRSPMASSRSRIPRRRKACCARYTGLLAESTVASQNAAADAMLFETYNPWAALVQLNSTNPLTGRRVAYLGEIAKAKGQAFADYDVEAAAARVHLDRGKLWGQFFERAPRRQGDRPREPARMSSSRQRRIHGLRTKLRRGRAGRHDQIRGRGFPVPQCSRRFLGDLA